MVFIALNIKRGLERVFNYKDFPSGFLISYFTICACCAVLSCSVISDSLWPHGLQPTRLLCPWGFSRQKYWSGLPWLPPGDLPNPGNEPRSQTLQADSWLSEPPGKSKNIGVGSLSLLQGIFPTQESKQGLLHFRWILYQLSYKGSPNDCSKPINSRFDAHIIFPAV